MFYYASLNTIYNLTPCSSIPTEILPALQLGMSVFTTFRTDASPCWRRAHYKRLHQNAQDLFGGMPPFRGFADALDDVIVKTVHPACHGNVYSLRVTLVPIAFTLSMAYQQETFSPIEWGVLIELRNAHPLSPYPSAFDELPCVDVHLARYQQIFSHLKQGSQLEALRLRKQLATHGQDVAWVSDHGHVTELTHANLFIHHPTHGWITPPPSQCLAGITRQQVLNAAKQINIPIAQTPIDVQMMQESDLAFSTNSGQGWVRIMHLFRSNEPSHTLEAMASTQLEARQVYNQWRTIINEDNRSCYS